MLKRQTGRGHGVGRFMAEGLGWHISLAPLLGKRSWYCLKQEFRCLLKLVKVISGHA